MLQSIPLNALEESMNHINNRTFTVRNNQAEGKTLFNGLFTVGLFCAVVFANFTLIMYWVFMITKHTEEISALLKNIRLDILADALKENHSLLVLGLVQGGIYLLTIFGAFVGQSLVSRRILFTKYTIGILVTITCCAIGSMLSMFGLSLFLENMPLNHRLIVSALLGLAFSVPGYIISKKIIAYHVPIETETLDIDTPYVQVQRKNGVAFEDLYQLERKKYADGTNSQKSLLLDEYDTAVEEKEEGRIRIKHYMPIILGIWAIFITMPFSGLAFLINSSTVEWAVNAFFALRKACKDSSNLTRAAIIGSIIASVHLYGVFVQIVSFFLGSLVGEVRCGHTLYESIIESITKTFLESIEIISNVCVQTLRSTLTFLMILFIEIPTEIITYIINRRYGAPFYRLFRAIYSLTFVIFGCWKGIIQTFMYFKLGMYPLEYLNIGNREDFFTSAKSTSTSLSIGLSMFMLSSLIIIGVLIFASIRSTRLPMLTSRLSNPIMGRSIRFWAIVAQALSAIVFIVIPSIFYSFTVRSQTILDLALQDIVWHAPRNTN
ncbi:hypothetical protein NEPAR06_0205 [Nematocida parisii]|uniref:Uncharacterized protein n=1 Tax=Nematocida parisii (strain ERTm3) TaxID=935791 RepID=I3EDC7_NEMP3|nr:hypothetical protein NEQG_02559 [Nematocida parisii ERTm3]KAI5143170.1 hypothetical protein NEPAR07_0532 [Nematocida parisii]KAI5153127.1 hypothetical protein NEPAR06_0205 [Nematocida parisii]